VDKKEELCGNFRRCCVCFARMMLLLGQKISLVVGLQFEFENRP